MKSCRCQRGETTVQAVLMVPVIFLLLLVGVHIASYLHASNVANSAAKRSAQVAAGMPDANQASLAATNAVSQMVNSLGARVSRPVDIAVSSNFVTVSVHLRISSIVPFVPDTVTKRGIARREVFVSEDER